MQSQTCTRVQSGLQTQIGELKQQILSLQDALSSRDKTFKTQSQLQNSVQVFLLFPLYIVRGSQ